MSHVILQKGNATFTLNKTNAGRSGCQRSQALSSLAEGTNSIQILIQASAMTHHRILLPPQTEMGDAAFLAHFCHQFCVFTYGKLGHLTPACLVVITSVWILQHHQNFMFHFKKWL